MDKEPFEQLGKFIFKFQHIEADVVRLIIYLAQADDEMIEIIISELGFFQRIKTLDVMFARFADLHKDIDDDEKKRFHKLISFLQTIAQRRNELVHSTYFSYLTLEKRIGLLRKNSKLSGSKGERQVTEEELHKESFEKDFKMVSQASQELHHFELQLIEWLHPETHD